MLTKKKLLPSHFACSDKLKIAWCSWGSVCVCLLAGLQRSWYMAKSEGHLASASVLSVEVVLCSLTWMSSMKSWTLLSSMAGDFLR